MNFFFKNFPLCTGAEIAITPKPLVVQRATKSETHSFQFLEGVYFIQKSAKVTGSRDIAIFSNFPLCALVFGRILGTSGRTAPIQSPDAFSHEKNGGL